MATNSAVKTANKRQMDVQPKSLKEDAVLIPAILWLLFLALHAFLVFSGSSHSSEYNILSRTWGLNNISYYYLPLIFLFYLINIALCLPVVNERFNELMNRAMGAKLFQMIRSRKYLKSLIFLLIGIFSVGMFRFFQIKYNFLGDMDIRV